MQNESECIYILNILTPEKNTEDVEQYNTTYLVTAFIKSLIFY